MSRSDCFRSPNNRKTLYRQKRKGPDISASMDKEEFKLLKLGANEIYKSKGDNKNPIRQEKSTINFAFACIASTKNIKRREID